MDKGTVTKVEVKELTVRVEVTGGLAYVFAVKRTYPRATFPVPPRVSLKLSTVVVDYAWCETSLGAEARAKHVHTYEAKDCPVVKEGLKAAREAAERAVS